MKDFQPNTTMQFMIPDYTFTFASSTWKKGNVLKGTVVKITCNFNRSYTFSISTTYKIYSNLLKSSDKVCDFYALKSKRTKNLA